MLCAVKCRLLNSNCLYFHVSDFFLISSTQGNDKSMEASVDNTRVIHDVVQGDNCLVIFDVFLCCCCRNDCPG